jgi:hypothetical protein
MWESDWIVQAITLALEEVGKTHILLFEATPGHCEEVMRSFERCAMQSREFDPEQTFRDSTDWSCTCQACVVAFSGTAPDRAAGDSESDAS